MFYYTQTKAFLIFHSVLYYTSSVITKKDKGWELKEINPLSQYSGLITSFILPLFIIDTNSLFHFWGGIDCEDEEDFYA